MRGNAVAAGLWIVETPLFTEHKMSDAQDEGRSVAATAHWKNHCVGVLLKNEHTLFDVRTSIVLQLRHPHETERYGGQAVEWFTAFGVQGVRQRWYRGRQRPVPRSAHANRDP